MIKRSLMAPELVPAQLAYLIKLLLSGLPLDISIPF